MKVDMTDIEETVEFPLTDSHDLRAHVESLCAFFGALDWLPDLLVH